MPTSSVSEGENYMLIASGPSHYAPFLSGWQEFKDHIRRIVDHQPGWAEVMPGPRKGEMQGFVRLEKRVDADAAYEHYTISRGLLVHLFKTSRTSGDYRLLKCNCGPYFPDMSERSHSPTRSGVQADVTRQSIPRAYSAVVPQYPVPTAYSWDPLYTQIPSYAQAPTYSNPVASVQQVPTYSASTNGIPVNVRHGAMLTEARGIFISNLSYQCTPNDLFNLLCTVGRTTDYKLHKDSRGQPNGAATAKFATKEEAHRAATHLNGKQHMGMTINARLDMNTTVIGQAQSPVIVNGSTASRG
ncbi:uncharacterized protein BDR25DRAFT_375311 [Lindgomyces ingoldianus]|uniref:Uncharacterized protein n=1 Tax=Lindgomyces ingoldianus TaxID=673940 RepID=A0ACB6RD46_9PLEO|nr:uncharacterized protein BDR25DRAFT_375311 [Lindgomyces ingoldianus]KAF2476391.1 hypothetical protein BDR25DRAFT_375311 [Lindgomyces ingoldianus]